MMTASDDEWTMQQAGTGCYLCAPVLATHADIILIEKLSVSTLYLTLDQRFRGQSVLILHDHVTRLDALGTDAYSAYMLDLRLSVSAIRESLQPEHMWDDSVLQDMRERPVTLTDVGYRDIIGQIHNQLRPRIGARNRP